MNQPRKSEDVPLLVNLHFVVVTLVCFAPWPFLVSDALVVNHAAVRQFIDVMGHVAPIVERFSAYRFPGAKGVQLNFAICWAIFPLYVLWARFVFRKYVLAGYEAPIDKYGWFGELLFPMYAIVVFLPFHWYWIYTGFRIETPTGWYITNDYMTNRVRYPISLALFNFIGFSGLFFLAKIAFERIHRRLQRR